MFPHLVPSVPLAAQHSTPPTSSCPPLKPNINPARAFLRSQDRHRIAFTYNLSPSHWSDCSLRSSKRFDDAVGFVPQSAFPSPRDLLLSSYFAASYSSFITSPLSRFLCRCLSAADDHVSTSVPTMPSKDFDSPSVSSPFQPRHSSLPFDCVRLPQPQPMSLFVIFSFTPFVLPPRSPFMSSNVHLVHQGPGCSSDDSSNGPAVPNLLSPLTALNQPVWSKIMLDKLLSFGEPGVAIRCNVRYVIVEPTIRDTIGSTTFPKYVVTGLGTVRDPHVLDSASTHAFAKDYAVYLSRTADLRALELSLIAYILDNVTASALTSLACQPSYNDLIREANSFGLFKLISSTFSSATNATMVHISTKNCFWPPHGQRSA